MSELAKSLLKRSLLAVAVVGLATVFVPSGAAHGQAPTYSPEVGTLLVELVHKKGAGGLDRLVIPASCNALDGHSVHANFEELRSIARGRRTCAAAQRQADVIQKLRKKFKGGGLQ